MQSDPELSLRVAGAALGRWYGGWPQASLADGPRCGFRLARRLNRATQGPGMSERIIEGSLIPPIGSLGQDTSHTTDSALPTTWPVPGR